MYSKFRNTVNYLNDLNKDYWNSSSWREFVANRLVDRKKMNEEVDRLLKGAKSDKERIELLREKLNEAYDDKEKLLKEIYELKQKLEHKEEVDSILSSDSGSSLDSDKISKRKEYLNSRVARKQQTSKQSTADERREIGYLNTIGDLRKENKQKDLRIKDLENQSSNTELLEILTRTSERAKRIDEELQQTQILIKK